jgi:hypothetical protein
MFRSGSGLLPEAAVLDVCVQGSNASEVGRALADLVTWKILIERKHLGAYGVFAGSDFDIEGAISQARGEIGTPDLQRLSALADLQPILAKRLYHETGTMRWFARRIIRLEEAESQISGLRPERGSVGTFVLCLPDLGLGATAARNRARRLSEEHAAKHLVVGLPDNAERIAELALELVACERVLTTRPELEGDSVARKELLGRISSVRTGLEDELGDAFGLARWFWQGELQDRDASGSISRVASSIAQKVYPGTPWLNSELINRDEPSSNSNKARKDLMYRMVSHGAQAELGYEGYPADAGLYFSVIKPLGLHRERESNQWEFGEPFVTARHEAMFFLWLATKAFLLEDGSRKKLSQLYELWANPPYGLRAGVMPVLAMAFFLAHRSVLALYVDGTFTSELSEANIDEWLLDPKRIELAYVSASSDQSAYVEAVAACLPVNVAAGGTAPLEVARALVGMVISLPNWTRRTTTLSADAQAIRAMLLKANDPHKVLFSDLPTLLDAREASDVLVKLRGVTAELVGAYPRVLSEVKATVLRALDQMDGDPTQLHLRARVVKGIAGDFRLEAFVARLETFDGSPESIEGLISLATSKPPAQWVDRDVDGALLQLATWAHDFRRAETVAPLRGRPSTRRAVGVVFGGGHGLEANASFDIDDKDASQVSKLAARLVVDLQKQPREIALAALAEAGALLLQTISEEAVQ